MLETVFSLSDLVLVSISTCAFTGGPHQRLVHQVDHLVYHDHGICIWLYVSHMLFVTLDQLHAWLYISTKDLA